MTATFTAVAPRFSEPCANAVLDLDLKSTVLVHHQLMCWDAGARPRECLAGSDCYSAAIAVAATSPAITLPSRNVLIATSSILSQSASTLPLC
jgi:hypothetical protein